MYMKKSNDWLQCANYHLTNIINLSFLIFSTQTKKIRWHSKALGTRITSNSNQFDFNHITKIMKRFNSRGDLKYFNSDLIIYWKPCTIKTH